MTILYLTFYFEPDLGAGSFRNTALVRELSAQLAPGDTLHVITNHPNRYDSVRQVAPDHEEWHNVRIDRLAVAPHQNNMLAQIVAFYHYFRQVHRLTNGGGYELVIASSSRLFTAFLAAKISRRYKLQLVLDNRDILRENLLSV